MRYLFIHQNFPGQFLHLVRRLVLDPDNHVLFISEPTENGIPGVRNFTYVPPVANAGTFDEAQEFEAALLRARIVQTLGERLRALGFRPDIIVGHHGWGELLNLRDVWPGVPVLGYFEFFYRTEGLDVGFDPEFMDPPGGLAKVRAKNAINLLALESPGHGQTPTQFQLSTYPVWAQERITLLPEGVNLVACRPDPAVRAAPMRLGEMDVLPGDKLVTFVSRDLEPYRGFHTMMRALPALHRARPDLKVVMIGRDEVSYGARIVDRTWREYLMAEVGGQIDLARVSFPGRVPYGQFVEVLQRSDAHVYLTYPFVLSWSLREALACGCAVVGSDTAPVREFVTHRKTGLLVRFPDAGALAEGVLEVLEDTKLAGRMGKGARRFAERAFDMERYLAAYEGLIARLVG